MFGNKTLIEKEKREEKAICIKSLADVRAILIASFVGKEPPSGVF